MFKWISKKLTKNYTEIPLFWVDYNRQTTDKKNCKAYIHPLLIRDRQVQLRIEHLIDYIRENYDLDEF